MNADVLAELLAEVKLLRKELQVFSAPLVKKVEKEFHEMKKQARFEEMMATTKGRSMTATDICRVSRFLKAKERRVIMNDLMRRGLINCQVLPDKLRPRKWYTWVGPSPAEVLQEAQQQAGN